jgi:hypothetical protein
MGPSARLNADARPGRVSVASTLLPQPTGWSVVVVVVGGGGGVAVAVADGETTSLPIVRRPHVR